jgi:hypothetical protein
VDSFRIINGKKYMWDGEDYESETAARENISKYENDNFQTKLIKEEGKHFVFTRRVVTEIVVEGEPV